MRPEHVKATQMRLESMTAMAHLASLCVEGAMSCVQEEIRAVLKYSYAALSYSEISAAAACLVRGVSLFLVRLKLICQSIALVGG